MGNSENKDNGKKEGKSIWQWFIDRLLDALEAVGIKVKRRGKKPCSEPPYPDCVLVSMSNDWECRNGRRVDIAKYIWRCPGRGEITCKEDIRETDQPC